MGQRRLYALLLSGQRYDHTDNVLSLQNYLIQEVSLSPSRIRLVSNSSDPIFVLKEIKDFFQNLPKEAISDVLIAYSGLGGRGKFAPNGHVIDYEDLGRQITNNGDFIFLNDCCYSGSSIDIFIELGLLPNLGMVLASSKKDNIQLANGFEDMIETFRKRK